MAGMTCSEGKPLYQLISVTGPDAQSFLQGQLTQDLRGVSGSRALPAAACTPKGRVLATLFIVKRDDGYDLVVPGDGAASLLQRLSLYRLRARLDLALHDDYLALAADAGANRAALLQSGLLPDKGTGETARAADLLVMRIGDDTVMLFGPGAALDALPLTAIRDDDSWRAALIRAGVVRIGLQVAEKFTPHMLSLDLAGAVSFNKGCYTGQEVVARTEHLGKSRRRLARYTGDTQGLAAGDEMTLDGEVIGTIVDAGGGEIVAVTPTDTHASVLQANGRAATPAPLPWSNGSPASGA